MTTTRRTVQMVAHRTAIGQRYSVKRGREYRVHCTEKDHGPWRKTVEEARADLCTHGSAA